MKGYTEKATELVSEWRHDIDKQELGEDQVHGELSRRIATAMAEMCEPVVAKLEETIRARDMLRDDLHKAHTDPLFCAAGEFFFVHHDRKKIGLRVHGSRITVYERRPHADYCAMQVSQHDWNS